ncbi:MAG: hypothetical protein NUW14_10530, partial [Deltaproteobacteria bacterium]|nr:hypothetical protein [Deltaproteobacteria bacterium]
RKNQPGADGHDRRRDLFSNPMLKRNQILAKSKPNWSGSANIPDENPDENTDSQDGGSADINRNVVREGLHERRNR